MGNYPSAVTRRLAITIAAYIDRFGGWPDEARLSSIALWGLAGSLDWKHFDTFASRFKVRVTVRSGIAVGGKAGHLVYREDLGAWSEETVELVERELGFDPASMTHDEPDLFHKRLLDDFGDDHRFHRFMIGELLALPDFGRELGIWHLEDPPAVSTTPLGGLFDLEFVDPDGQSAYLDIWLRRPSMARCEAQADAVGGSPRVYLLLNGTRPSWAADGTATWLLRPDIERAVKATAFGRRGDDALGDLARAYSARLSWRESPTGAGRT